MIDPAPEVVANDDIEPLGHEVSDHDLADERGVVRAELARGRQVLGPQRAHEARELRAHP